MNSAQPPSRAYNWEAVTPLSIGIRSRELMARVKWFVNLRWLAVLLCAGATLGAALQLLPARLNPYYFGVTTLLLAVANVVYTIIARNLPPEDAGHRQAQGFLVVQMLGDFFALGVVTYACGSIETPILTLFLAHIILATLFFGKKLSLAIIVAAWAFASAPLVLEWGSLLPVVSIFDSDFKLVATDSYLITGGFVVGEGGVFFFCWYLVGVISRSLKLRERQLERAHEMLITMDREKTQATLRATHELKAPFAAIKSYVYTLRDGYCGDLPDKAGNVVDRIGARCDQLTDKITDIIHLSNLRSLIVTELDLGPVDLVELLAEEAREGGLMGEPRGITVKNLAAEHDPVVVTGSKPHLRALFSNLIQNAVHYSLDRGDVEIVLQLEGERISVCVRDQGIGIPPENLDKIFDEHFRSNTAVAHYPGGTGLGLPIVKEIARLHGATVRVESEQGKGTRFFVNFALSEAKNQRGKHG